jgi:hypothetical protein
MEISQLSKAFRAALATYLLVHAAYWLSGLNPIRTIGGVGGWVIDFAIWCVVYVVVYWLVSKLAAKGPR